MALSFIRLGFDLNSPEGMGNLKPQFSIVVPVYNNAEYLPACLDSLLAQTLNDWEAVVVVDGSPDNAADIAREYASADSRFIVVEKPENEGLHLARKTGVEKLSGEYVLFLDGDDALAESALAALAEALADSGSDILHFGIAVTSFGVPESERKAFEEHGNRPCRDLFGADIAKYSFDSGLGYLQDWRVTQRVYTSELVKDAFLRMTDMRLERAEDSYEYFVIASLASHQTTLNNIVALEYNYGLGVTGSSALSADAFLRSAKQFRKCMNAILAYAASDGCPLDSAQKLASDANAKLMDLLFNDWLNRLSTVDKVSTVPPLGEMFGGVPAATQVMRCVRDKSYELWVQCAGCVNTAQAELLFNESEALFIGDLDKKKSDSASKTYCLYRDAARGHLNDLKKRNFILEKSSQPLRIFISAHKPVDLFESDILQPVEVGASLRANNFPWAWHDNEGENISDQNPMYCELTAQYWAWKNVDAEYYGFCHYRRYFNFSSKSYKENPWGEIIEPTINAASQKKYGLDDESIRKAIEGFDVVTTEVKDLTQFPGEASTPLQQYEAAPKLDIEDLYHVFAIVQDMYPEYTADIEAFANGHRSCFCNMFIMKKQIFMEYCAWLFPILERFVFEWDCSLHSKEGLRTPGHLAERLLNIYLIHGERVGVGWKRKEAQCVHFEFPDKRNYSLNLPEGYEKLSKPIIPVVFAADNNYVPMLTTTIYSMLENASKDYFYDVVVIEDGITGENKQVMQEFFAVFPNATLRFFGAGALISGYELTTSNAHISKETYYRFLIQDILPFYGKVLYLDSDLIIEGDVSELYGVGLGGNLLAAAHDVDYMGNLNMPYGKRMEYTKEVLQMEDPYSYFQAGVLVLNTAEMRKLHTVKEWMEIASNPDYIYNDQDILNANCEGRVSYLSYEWNVMHDCGGRVANVFSYAPASAFDAYNSSRSNPKIIHYAGFEKPWIMPECDYAEHYWHYARRTPFYEKLIALIAQHRVDLLAMRLEEEARPAKAIGDGNPIRKVVDPLMPLGTRRREFAKSVGRTLRGRS